MRTSTIRDCQVLELLAEGYSNDEIGKRLGIGSTTVSQHLRMIIARSGVKGRVGLIKANADLIIRAKDNRTALKLWAALTDEQRILVKLSIEDLSLADMGAYLNRSRASINNHLHNIYDALGVSSRLELVVWYVSQSIKNGSVSSS